MSTTTRRLDDITETVQELVPTNITVTSVEYEGPELVIYTTTPREFFADPDKINEIAIELKKRITIRPDPEICIPQADAEEAIHTIAPDQARITNISFNEQTTEVFIEAERPGMVIGRNGETLRELTAETGWAAEVLRTPPLESNTVSSVRNYLTQEREERREILQRIGRQIHRPPTSDEEFVRVTTLGCCQEVGRAAFVLSTGETRILIDCGDKPG